MTDFEKMRSEEFFAWQSGKAERYDFTSEECLAKNNNN